MSSRPNDALGNAEELLARGDLRGAVDVMIESSRTHPCAGAKVAAIDTGAMRTHVRAIADLDPSALARVAAGMGLTAIMRAARGQNAAIVTAQALLLIELADRELLERVLGGGERIDRLVAALEGLRRESKAS